MLLLKQSSVDSRSAMESTGKQDVFVKRTTYNSSLLWCLLAGIGVCFAVLPVLPSPSGNQDITTKGQLSYAISRGFLTVGIFFFAAFALWAIRNRERFHKEQRVFLPMQCRHCARTLGLIPESEYQTVSDPGCQKDRLENSGRRLLTESTTTPLLPADSAENDRPSIPRPSHSPSTIMTSSVPLLSESTQSITVSQEMSETCNSPVNALAPDNHTPTSSPPSTVREDSYIITVPQPRQHSSLYSRPHKSLLNVMYLFGTISVLNIPIQIIGVLLCLKDDTSQSAILTISLVIQLFLDIAYVLLIIVATAFFNVYYDAAFVNEAQFAYPIAFTLGCTMWITGTKLIYPIAGALGSQINAPDYPCKLNGTYGKVMLKDEVIMTQFYGECCLIGAGLFLQLWNSLLPPCCIRKTETRPSFEHYDENPSVPLLKRICIYLQGSTRKLSKVRTLWCAEGEKQRLLNSGNVKTPHLSKCTLIVAVFLTGVYFALCLFIENADIPALSHKNKLCIIWCIDMAVCVPLLLLCHHQSVITGSKTMFSAGNDESIFHKLVKGHDRILFLSCSAIFTINIFRLVAGFGMLPRIGQLQTDEVILVSLTIVYAIFQIFSVWVLTSFLLVVQRQSITGSQNVKVTLVCLIYTAMLFIAQWLLDEMQIGPWPELHAYFGRKTGNLIGALIEPLTALFGVHACMVAYESYKSISRGDLNIGKSEKNRDT